MSISRTELEPEPEVAICIKIDESCIQIDELCIQKDDLNTTLQVFPGAPPPKYYDDHFIHLPIRKWMPHHTSLGVEPLSWALWNDIEGPVEPQIGGRDLRKDLKKKSSRQLAADKGHRASQPNGVREGWVALRAAAPTMMLLLYVPESDSVKVMYVSGRRE